MINIARVIIVCIIVFVADVTIHHIAVVLGDTAVVAVVDIVVDVDVLLLLLLLLVSIM